MGIWQNIIIDSQKNAIFFDCHSIINVSSVYINLDRNGKMGLLSTPHSSAAIYPSEYIQHYALALDGRINNKPDICKKLHLNEDTEIENTILKLYIKYGYNGFYFLDGAFSLILYDKQKQMTLLYRSFPSGYSLYYVKKNNLLTVSTNPVYLLHRSDISDRLNPEQINALFSLNLTLMTETVFSDINEVEPGQIIMISSEGVVSKKRLFGEIFQSHKYDVEANIVETYHNLVESMMQKNIFPNLKYGIMLSSGMDSSTLAYFASQQLQMENRKLHAYSWTLPNFQIADETKQIKRLATTLGMDLTLIDAENYAPFDDLDHLPLHPESPSNNIFWSMTSQMYTKTSEDRIDILLNGHFGDDQYPGMQNLFIDMLADQRFDLFIPSIKSIIEQYGFRDILKKSPEIRGLVKSFSSLKRWKKAKYNAPEWLSDEAKEINKAVWEKSNFNDIKEENKFSSISSRRNWNTGVDRYYAGIYDIERMEPYRDLELLNFTLGIPSYMAYRDGQMKYFAREAMKGLLPEFIRNQPRVGVLCEFAHDSFMKNQNKVRERLFDDPSSWNTYVDEQWMQNKFKKDMEIKGKDILIIWKSLNIGPWQKAIKPGGSLYEDTFMQNGNVQRMK